MARRDIRVLLLACLLAVLAAAAQSVVGLDTGLLFLAPALVMALALLAGRYPGERHLAAVRQPRPRRALRFTGPAALPRLERLLPRGGRLIAASLAVRPPPSAPSR